MKKVLPIVIIAFLALFFTNSAFAISFDDTEDLSGIILAEGPVAELGHTDSYTYSHATPSDFEVPFDTVTSAMLTISGYWIDGDNDVVEVSGTAVGSLVSGGEYGSEIVGFEWVWAGWDSGLYPIWEDYDEPSVSLFDISSVFSSWSSGQLLEVTLNADGTWGDGIIELSSSTFSLDYENGTAPVPEPATMLLLGTGLVGLAVGSRKKFFKK